MNDDLKKAIKKSQISAQEAHPKERATFKTLLLTNPNYFGNLKESALPQVVGIIANTFYEELACVGFQPQQERLEAVVYVYQPSGYGSNVCGAGTPEFVRFYSSFDNGATWQDQGLTSFQAFNVPEGTDGGKRLEYAVSLACSPKRLGCTKENLIRVRAILSWNNAPPPNQPNWAPVWGNVREATVQVAPLPYFHIKDLFDFGKLKIPEQVKALFADDTQIAAEPKALSVGELSELYKGRGVPAHRMAHKELLAFNLAQASLNAEAFAELLPGIAIDPGLFDLLFPKTGGDTSFEELTCIGLEPNMPDTLVGVIQVKKTLGYSGALCTQGSREYVTFWGDFDGNGSFETCLGTAQVAVHDLANVPGGGVHYAVRLPVNLEQYRRPCKEGPRVVRIRAILSWNTPAPCSDPNHVPTWGNREETLINIAPRKLAPPGHIAILGGIPVSHIDGTTGLTDATAVFATNNLPPDSLGRPCPFGGRVTAQGVPVLGQYYMVEVSPDGSSWTPQLTDLTVVDQFGVTHVHKADPVTKRFKYLDFVDNTNNLLAHWDTNGDARWYVRLSTFDAGGILQGVDTHVVQLDNTGPEASLHITTGTGDCGRFSIGASLGGSFVARDTYLASYNLHVEPTVNPAGVGVPSPSGAIVQTAPSPGNTWSLDTTGMRECGYIVRLEVYDRAIINSQFVGHYNTTSVGFCLLSNLES